jgi:hypothetical protein
MEFGDNNLSVILLRRDSSECRFGVIDYGLRCVVFRSPRSFKQML